jgi:glutamine synthetase
VIDVFIEWKRKQEVDAIRMRPHPYEYALYYDM